MTKGEKRVKVAFISNYLNHHQLPFCLEMSAKEDVEYYFIATEKISRRRINLGYEDMNSKYDFVIETYQGKEEEKKAQDIINTSDFVIIGSAPEYYINQRKRENLFIFRYSERIFKQGIFRLATIKTILNLRIKRSKEKKKPIYMLCSSAYAKQDYQLAGLYQDKCYKWGYFPETVRYNIDKLIQDKGNNETIKLLWVARFIDWKHPEVVVELAEKLQKENYKFKIEMIGCGEMLDEIKKIVKQKKLNNVIEIVGAVKSEKVREYMEKANIFLATSDQNEGWGAVINEAMNSGCAVVGNKKIGSVPYLIENNKNGIIYENKQEFFEKVKYLIDNKEMRDTISKNAYNTITNIWNAQIATENLIKLYEKMKNKQIINIVDGPCSKA